MKNTNRVRKNRSAAKPASQAKTTDKTVTVIFYSVGDDSEIARVDFSKEIFKTIEHTCKKLCISLEQFFNQAMAQKLKEFGIKLASGGIR